MDREGALLSEMLEIVEQRDSLRSMLEEDRQRWALFLNLIDLAKSSLEDDVFARNDSPDEPAECSDHQLEHAQLEQNDDSDCFVDSEEEFNHLVFDDDDDSIQITGSLNDLFELDHVPDTADVPLAQTTVEPKLEEQNDTRNEKSQQTELNVEQKDFDTRGILDNLEQIAQTNEETEMDGFVPREKSLSIDFDEGIDDEDVQEFDRLVQDLSDHSVSSIDSRGSLKRKAHVPVFQLVVDCEGEPVEAENPPSPAPIEQSPRKADDRPISSTSETSEFYYQIGKTVEPKLKSPKASPILQRKVQVFDEMERSTRRYSPFNGEFEGRTVELSDLVSEQELDIYYDYDGSDDADEPARRRSHIVQRQIETFHELDRKGRKYSLQADNRQEKDWGSMGVKFSNRGAVRNLVWQWEFNNWQAAGCQGSVPDAPEWKERRIATPTPHDEQSDQSEHATKNRKRKKSKTEVVTDSQVRTSNQQPGSETAGRSSWQLAVVIWLVIFCFFILSSLLNERFWHLY